MKKEDDMRFELYRDARKELRWRIRAKNGRIIADSAESYKSERAALNGIMIVKSEAQRAPIRMEVRGCKKD